MTIDSITSSSDPRITEYPRRWFAAMVMMIAALMDLIDVTIVNVALPTIRREIGASGTQLEWVISAYLLAFAATLIAFGGLGDLFGRKRVFIGGVVLFGLASLASGLSQSPDQLIVARVVQGVAAAAMAPQVLATFRAIFSGKERGQAFALYGAIGGMAAALGVVLGGVLVSANLFGWGWRTVFFVNLPVAVFALVGGTLVIPESRDRNAGRLDIPGVTLLIAALVAIVYPLLEGRELGWPVWIFVLLAAGLASLGALFLVEDRRQHAAVAPVLRTRLFRVPAFGTGLAVQLAFSAALQGFFLTFTLWIQIGQRFTALHAGLTLVAFSVGAFVPAAFAIPLAQRYGRFILAAGGIMLAVGTAWIDGVVTSVGVDTNPWPIVPGLIVAGAGLAFLVIPLVNVVLASVPVDAAGGASGLFSTAQQLGGAIGVAGLGTIFFGYVGSHSFTAAFQHAAPLVIGIFILCTLLSLLLPQTAVVEEFVEPELIPIDSSIG